MTKRQFPSPGFLPLPFILPAKSSLFGFLPVISLFLVPPPSSSTEMSSESAFLFLPPHPAFSRSSVSSIPSSGASSASFSTGAPHFCTSIILSDGSPAYRTGSCFFQFFYPLLQFCDVGQGFLDLREEHLVFIILVVTVLFEIQTRRWTYLAPWSCSSPLLICAFNCRISATSFAFFAASRLLSDGSFPISSKCHMNISSFEPILSFLKGMSVPLFFVHALRKRQRISRCFAF